MKLSVSRAKRGIVGYTIFINKAEAEASGFIDANGNPVEVEKEVDAKNGKITIKRMANGVAREAIKSAFVYQNIDKLKAGEQAITARKAHYTLKGNTLYRQDHQSYLRGEAALPYAELVGGVFYELRI